MADGDSFCSRQRVGVGLITAARRSPGAVGRGWSFLCCCLGYCRLSRGFACSAATLGALSRRSCRSTRVRGAFPAYRPIVCSRRCCDGSCTPPVTVCSCLRLPWPREPHWLRPLGAFHDSRVPCGRTTRSTGRAASGAPVNADVDMAFFVNGGRVGPAHARGESIAMLDCRIGNAAGSS